MLQGVELARRGARTVAELDEPLRNFYADLKIIGSLDGAPVYITMFSRVDCQIPGREAIALYATAALTVFRLDHPAPDQLRGSGEHAYRVNVIHTGFVLDPQSFEPIEGLEQPITGEWLEASGTLYEDQYIVTPFGGYSAVRPDYFADDELPSARARPYFVLGDEVIFPKAATFRDEGPHQPRGSTLLWRAPLAEVLDSRRVAANAVYDYHSSSFAWERAWLGFRTGDPARLNFHAMGRKVMRREDGAPMVMRLVREFFPDRLEV
ncbi:MAG: hypothetical protein JJU27_04165 [Gammaproteobacteria bacterium]|nr:hypothetical protein [Gammaproteobacteria bacterium]